MKTSQLQYDAAPILSDFRSDVGYSRFGLVIQALFAHVLLRMGAVIIDVRNPGHPDIIAKLNGVFQNIEVEAPGRKTAFRRLQSGDLEVLRTGDSGQTGFFCVLDCGPPVEWLCVDVANLGSRVNEDLRISLLRAYAEKDYSAECTVQFSDLIVKEASFLPQLRFGRLRKEALEGNYR